MAKAHRKVNLTTEELAREMLRRVADKWTLLVITVLAETDAVMRFPRLWAGVGGISQKMLTKTLGQLERDEAGDATRLTSGRVRADDATITGRLLLGR